MPKLITVPWTSSNTNLPTLITVSSEINAFKSAILTNSGAATIDLAISTADLDAITDFLLSLKGAVISGATSNLLPKIAYCLPLAGLSLDAARTPITGAAATVTGYLSGDYSRSGGLVGGSGKSFGTGFAISSLPSNDAGLLVYTRASNTGTTHDILAGSGASTFGMSITTNRVNIYGYTVTTGSGSIDNMTGNIGTAAMHGFNIVGSTLNQYKDGAVVATGATGGTRPTAPIPIFRNTNIYGGFLITSGATNAEFAYINNQFKTLMTAFGR